MWRAIGAVAAAWILLGWAGVSWAIDLPKSGPATYSNSGSEEDDPKVPPCSQTPPPAYCACPDLSAPAAPGGSNPTPAPGGQAGNPQNAAAKSDPISVIDGRQIVSRTDLIVPGVYPIRLTRRYDSRSSYDSPLGYGWSHGFDLKLLEYSSDGSVVVRNSCGYQQRFEDQGGTLTPEVGRQETLTSLGNGTYVLRYPRGAEARFNAQGNLEELRDRNGNRLIFEYEDVVKKHDLMGTSPFAVDPTVPMTVARVYQLERVYEQLADGNPTGRDITFAYDGTTGRLVSATTFDGRKVEYVHDDAGSGQTEGNLTEVHLHVEQTQLPDPPIEIIETYGYDINRSLADTHNLTSIQLGQGETAWFMRYDEQDRVTEQTRGDCDGAGCDRELTFDYSTPLTTVVTRLIKNAGGTVTGTAVDTYEYDTNKLLTLHADALGNEFRYFRDGNGFLDFIEVHQWNGTTLDLQKTIDYAYSFDGDLIEKKVILDSGEEVTETWAYAPLSHWVSAYQVTSDAPNSQIFRTEYTFYGSGSGITNIREIRRRNGGNFETTLLEYDANGRLEFVTPPVVVPADNLKFQRTYQAAAGGGFGLLASIEIVGDPHLKKSFTYDAGGFLDGVTDARNFTTNHSWDDLGRLIEVKNPILPERESTHYRYSGPGPIASAQPGRYLTEVEVGQTGDEPSVIAGRLRRFVYDGEGRVATVQRKDGSWQNFREFQYDSDDNQLQAQYSAGAPRTITSTHDLLARLKSVTDDAPVDLSASPNTTSFEYDAVGNRTKVTDAKNRSTVFTFDDLDRLIEVQQLAESLTTGFAYDAAGNVITVTDPKTLATVYTYDDLSRLLSVTPQADVGTPPAPLPPVVYSYDGRGRLDTVTNARGQVLDYAYFAWGGLEEIDHVGASRVVSYEYDDSGNLTSTTDSTIPTSELDSKLYDFTYDRLNRVDELTAYYKPGVDQVLDSDYDRFGNRNGLTYSDGTQVLNHSWTYDDLDRLETADLAASGPITFAYHANDDLDTITRANQVASTYAYWGHGPLRSITVENSGNGQLHDLQYTGIDRTLNVTNVTETRVVSQPKNFVYGYDGVDRLVSANNPAGYVPPLQPQESYLYDAAGNRETDGAATDYDYDQANRIKASPGATWTFDVDGNVSTRTETVEERFTYDFANRLRGWENGPVTGPTGTADYTYDPFGRRIKKTANGVTTWFLWDGDDLLAEFDGAGVRTRRYTYAGGFAPIEVADVSGPGTEDVFDVHVDHLDTPRLMTSNASQLPVWRQSHESFGTASVETGGSESLNVRFPGQYFDDETGLHYNRFRYYDPKVGRYSNADPVGQFGALNWKQVALSRPRLRATAFLDDDFQGSAQNAGIPREVSLRQAVSGGNLNALISRTTEGVGTLSVTGSNSFTYGLDNPASFTDPTGEYGLAAAVVIVVAAAAVGYSLWAYSEAAEACKKYCDQQIEAGQCVPGDTRCYRNCMAGGTGLITGTGGGSLPSTVVGPAVSESSDE